MSLYEVLNNYCNRCSGAVSKEDKKKFSYMLRRLFAAQYPIQCEWLNRLDTDALCSSEIIALIASRYNGLPNLMVPVVTDNKKAGGALSWAVSELKNRISVFSSAALSDGR